MLIYILHRPNKKVRPFSRNCEALFAIVPGPDAMLRRPPAMPTPNNGFSQKWWLKSPVKSIPSPIPPPNMSKGHTPYIVPILPQDCFIRFFTRDTRGGPSVSQRAPTTASTPSGAPCRVRCVQPWRAEVIRGTAQSST